MRAYSETTSPREQQGEHIMKPKDVGDEDSGTATTADQNQIGNEESN